MSDNKPSPPPESTSFIFDDLLLQNIFLMFESKSISHRTHNLWKMSQLAQKGLSSCTGCALYPLRGHCSCGLWWQRLAVAGNCAKLWPWFAMTTFVFHSDSQLLGVRPDGGLVCRAVHSNKELSKSLSEAPLPLSSKPLSLYYLYTMKLNFIQVQTCKWILTQKAAHHPPAEWRGDGVMLWLNFSLRIHFVSKYAMFLRILHINSVASLVIKM